MYFNKECFCLGVAINIENPVNVETGKRSGRVRNLAKLDDGLDESPTVNPVGLLSRPKPTSRLKGYTYFSNLVFPISDLV